MAPFRYRIWLSLMFFFFVRKLAAEASPSTASLTSREKANSCRTALGEPEEPQPRLSMLQHGHRPKSAEVSTAAIPEQVEQQKVNPVNASRQTPVGSVIAGLQFFRERLVALDCVTREGQVSTYVCLLMMAVVAMLCIVWLFTPEASEEAWRVDVMMPHASPKTMAGRPPQQRNMWASPSYNPSPRAPGLTACKSTPVLGSPGLGSPALTPARGLLAQLHPPPPQHVDNWGMTPRTLVTSASVPMVMVPGIPMVMPPPMSPRSSQTPMTLSSRSHTTPPQLPVSPTVTPPRTVNEASYYHRRIGNQAVGNVAYEGQRSNRLMVPRLNLPMNPQ